MGKWYDEESEERSRQKAAEHFRKAGEGWQRFTDGLERDAEREQQWNQTLDHLLANPQVIDVITPSYLESHLIEAETRVKKLKRKISRGDEMRQNLKPTFPSKAAGLLDLISGLGASMVDEEISKNEQLIRLIKARKEREKRNLPAESPAQEAARKKADEVEQMNLTLTLLEERRREAIKNHPDQEEAINRRFRKAADAILEQS